MKSAVMHEDGLVACQDVVGVDVVDGEVVHPLLAIEGVHRLDRRQATFGRVEPISDRERNRFDPAVAGVVPGAMVLGGVQDRLVASAIDNDKIGEVGVVVAVQHDHRANDGLPGSRVRRTNAITDLHVSDLLVAAVGHDDFGARIEAVADEFEFAFLFCGNISRVRGRGGVASLSGTQGRQPLRTHEVGRQGDTGVDSPCRRRRVVSEGRSSGDCRTCDGAYRDETKGSRQRHAQKT
jgi:hypothetical protein